MAKASSSPIPAALAPPWISRNRLRSLSQFWRLGCSEMRHDVPYLWHLQRKSYRTAEHRAQCVQGLNC